MLQFAISSRTRQAAFRAAWMRRRSSSQGSIQLGSNRPKKRPSADLRLHLMGWTAMEASVVIHLTKTSLHSSGTGRQISVIVCLFSDCPENSHSLRHCSDEFRPNWRIVALPPFVLSHPFSRTYDPMAIQNAHWRALFAVRSALRVGLGHKWVTTETTLIA